MYQLLDYSKEGLLTALSQWQEVPSYRIQQIFEWIYQRRACSIDDMNNLPKNLRAVLQEHFTLSLLDCVKREVSKDGTIKYLFRMEDEETIETVLIPTAKRKTICVSTQIGCAMACIFCNSGLLGLKRNLETSEILAQLLGVMQAEKDVRISHIVFMGIGEPLHNYDNLIRAIDVINDPSAFGIGARRITISTSGLVKGIDKLAEYGKQVELAISLHASNDEKRTALMPINKRFPLAVLMKTCRNYVDKTGRQLTFEYVMLKDVNDSLEDARALAKLLRGLCAKVNLIPYNTMSEERFQCSSMEQMKLFQSNLEGLGVVAPLRIPRGRDIAAACGQLKLEN